MAAGGFCWAHRQGAVIWYTQCVHLMVQCAMFLSLYKLKLDIHQESVKLLSMVQ